jgi:hypothetical protein
MPALKSIDEGPAGGPAESLERRLKLFIRRRLSPSRERAFKRFTNEVLNRFSWASGRGIRPTNSFEKNNLAQLQPGDWVIVRSLEDIQATLNHWRQLKGCTFMPEMNVYCETTHRILKPLQRFVDERDLLVKRSTGIYLLDGVMCQGTTDFGRCDRSCYYFWRVEWLEKTDPPSA